ncbi:MAG: type IV secretion system DNA-binding domain-containing protein [Verrucomicrobia bacterium]|nr:type IV secretion system DNA-binding domain-containing protein [Verrucomicrobiota bacterium]
MTLIDEKLSRQFLAWERRGRGWDVFSCPVAPEPPFRPFKGHVLPAVEVLDDGRKPTLASAWIQSLGRSLAGTIATPTEPQLDQEEPPPTPFERGSLVELPALLPPKFDPRRETFEQFITSLTLCREPFAFELQGTAEAISVRLVAHPADAPAVQQQMQTFFPEVACIATEDDLTRAWEACEDAGAAVVEFGLAEPFMRPLASGKFEPFVGLIGALNDLQPGELGLYQVLFRPVQNEWAESAVWSVTHADGRPFFVNAPELADDAKRKMARPLYAAVLRIATRAADFDRTWEIARRLAGALRVFAHPSANELIPLRNDRYPFEAHVDDVLRRQSHRTGMLLNLDELLGFVHLPTSEVRSPKLLRHFAKTKPAPDAVTKATGCFLGWNVHLGNQRGVWLTAEQRVRHTHIVGASGTGKSTLLFNLIRQDIAAGEGVALLDPHGDLVDQLLSVIPPTRIGDVILLDPAAEEFSIGFNILSAHSDWEKTLLASDLVSVFQRLSTSWGDQMGSVLNNAILAFLESAQGGTLADLRRFLLEPAFREKFLTTVRDPDIVYYWRKGFAQLTGNKSIGPVLTRLETFLAPKPIRYMVSQPVNRLDFADILDSGKIFLAKLSQGLIGQENAHLLGSLLMAKFQQTAMARQRQQSGARRDFWLYLDECHHFITPSTAEILSGARKYRVGLSLAHQELRHLQRDPEVASAVMANCCTRICFRVGDQDARVLEGGFSFFEARDLQNLGTGEAVCRVERSEWDFNLTVPLPELPSDAEATTRRREVITASREKYATRREVVEATLQQCSIVDLVSPRASPPKPSREPTRVADDTSATAPTPRPEAVLPTQPANAPAITTVNLPAAAPVAAKSASAAIPVIRPVTAADETKKSFPVGEAGRGGIQHKAIQKRIKAAADTLGFQTAIEHTILDGAGSVDVLLARGGAKIACEITVTTTVDHEVGNVAKCAKAGFQEIAVVAVTAEKLARVETAVANSLGPDIAPCVGYFLPDQFIAHLQTLPQPPPPAPDVRVSRGYKIKRFYPQLSPEEAKAREGAAIQAIADLMRRKPQ